MIRLSFFLPLFFFKISSVIAQNEPDVKKDSVQVLNEVTVKGSKKLISNKDGRLVLNVENSVLSAIKDPVELVSKVPSVQVSPDGERINVVGKGEPLIYIDNQRVSVNDLRSLSVADIKSIELINDPPAKYEASARSVILITRKTNGREGIKGELAQTAAVRKYYLNRAGTNISYRKKKLELKGSFQYNQLKTWEGNAFDMKIGNANILSRYNVTAVTTRPQFIAGAGVFFQLNEEEYFSVNTNLRKQNESFPVYTTSYLKTPTREENVLTSNFNDGPEKHLTANFNYNNRFNKNKASLFAGAQYTEFSDSKVSEIYDAANGSGSRLTQQRRQNSSIQVLALRADFEKTITSKIKYEVGANVSRAEAGGFTDMLIYDPNNTVHSNFDYAETNTALYSQFSGKINELGYSAGIRMEDTKVKSLYEENNSQSVIDRHNTQLFPKASLSIPVDSSKTISFNYARSISRPNYSSANQASVYINPYFEWANNINITASLTEELSGKLQFNDYSIVFALYQTRGPLYSSFDYDEQNTRLRRTNINYDKESGMYMSVTVPFRYKIWSSTNVMNIIRSTIEDKSASTGKTRPFVYFNSTNDFRLPQNFVFTLSAWAVTKSYSGAYERSALYAVDTSLTKTIFKNLVCTIRYSDMFGTINSDESFSINDVAANGRFYDNVREFSVGLKYSFGKLKTSIYKNREVDESADRVR